MKKQLTAIAALLLVSSMSFAAEYNARTIKFAATSPKGTPPAIGMEMFAEKVAERSGGKIKVRTFPNGVLGGDVQVLSSLQGGVIEMMTWNAGLMLNHVTDFGILDFPFLYTDTAKVDAMLDGEVGKMLTDQLPQQNLVGLAFWELGVRNLTNNKRPVTKLEDIAGLKVRAQQSPLFLDVWSALGANPTPLPFTEVHTALETGTVDGQENPAALILASKFNEVQKYLSLTRHNYNPQIVLIGKGFWDKLNDDEKKLLTDVAMEVRLEQRRISREADSKAIAELEAAGMQVNELPEAEITRIQEKIKPVVAKYAAKIDPELVKKVYEAMDVPQQ
ncbi:TRAP-T family transporter periplasmic binding protein [Ectopseudomonas mendocina]|jgi:tripartite ATP-independent transporter DctP family solute receptor|uniref:TRAP-T family transporter periplasmic binding protein n=2 Tax=Ectopseudomonas mendocina TaxID=300 RepID=A0A379IZJ9_ECTME|nr:MULTISPECIES: TRAP transporter substrate-binding protein [Pseudomonas]AEB56864.1 TRAP-T family transporter periplasmic binding protein [Pseudomonas mendocina NK-01]ALN20738.1 ABC transporter substrate-binding protein [Pseudomonas mendocina S5.2]KER98341.1 ABC transporter substrate-binding protein [Pseudomonas mendocina]QTN44141.1 TRAP transporter substrate-binding protein [Pseudomonas mendocina]TRO34330.1 TRAP transporter substrate-binding protein [Pseudomonas sp. ALS1131]